MSRERLVLLVLLAVSVVVAAAIVFVPIVVTEIRGLDQRIAVFESRLDDLGPLSAANTDTERRVALLRERLNEAEQRYFAQNEMDIFDFATAVQATVTSFSLVIERVQATETGEMPLVEFHATGTTLDCLRLLRHISDEQPRWRVPFASLSPNGRMRTADLRMRIGYETLPQ